MFHIKNSLQEDYADYINIDPRIQELIDEGVCVKGPGIHSYHAGLPVDHFYILSGSDKIMDSRKVLFRKIPVVTLSTDERLYTDLQGSFFLVSELGKPSIVIDPQDVSLTYLGAMYNYDIENYFLPDEMKEVKIPFMSEIQSWSYSYYFARQFMKLNKSNLVTLINLVQNVTRDQVSPENLREKNWRNELKSEEELLEELLASR